MWKKRYRFPVLVLAILMALSAVSALAAGNAGGNSAPVAENLELATYRGVSVGGRLSAVDPDGDAVHFELTTAPNKGKLELEENGSFVYTPEEGKRGKDYFGYRAVDAQGNTSQEATVIIRIQKQKTDVRYTDTAGLSCDYAAHALAEAGVMVGQFLGGQYVFEPDREISRGEFLSVCMDIAGVDTLSGVKSTGFSDDEAIPVWIKPYVSTALLSGTISGYAGEDGAIFDAAAAVSHNEAAVMLDRVLAVTDVSNTSAWTTDDVPTWAVQSVANLAACDIYPTGGIGAPEALTRAEAADMLARAMLLMEA